jgi:phosphate/sulfate permease
MMAFLIVFIFVALLLTLKPVVELVRKLVETLGGSLPPTELIQNTAANFVMLGVGAVVLAIAVKVTIPILSFMLIAGAAAMVGLALYNVFRTFGKQSVQKILPEGKITTK